ncbi:MAG: maleylpyruvate isomerase N-terminal domain-containing protein [Mycobacteriales bacterium]
MLGPDPFPRPCGLAETDPLTLGDAVVGAWDDFLTLVQSADLSRPSRLAGWTGRDTCIHLGSWDDHRVLLRLVEAARSGGGSAPPDVDGDNARLVAAHRDATDADVVAALERSRDVVAEWFESDEPAELATARVRSAVGELPLLSLVHAGCYELAVHALDLGPCDAPAPSSFLLDRGLGAICDVTGALSTRTGIDITVTAQTPDGGWTFTSTADGWTTSPVPPGPYSGIGARGTAADLLDVAAGRAAIPALFVSRRLVVQQLPSFMRLAPLLTEVPGIPGGPALRAGVAGLARVTGTLGRVVDRLRR